MMLHSKFKCKFYKHIGWPNLAMIVKFNKIVKLGGCTQLLVYCTGLIQSYWDCLKIFLLSTEFEEDIQVEAWRDSGPNSEAKSGPVFGTMWSRKWGCKMAVTELENLLTNYHFGLVYITLDIYFLAWMQIAKNDKFRIFCQQCHL